MLDDSRQEPGTDDLVVRQPFVDAELGDGMVIQGPLDLAAQRRELRGVFRRDRQSEIRRRPSARSELPRIRYCSQEKGKPSASLAARSLAVREGTGP